MNRYIILQKILEYNSFTKAADAMGYTQSSVSQMINSLENEMGIKLLSRSRYGVKLTIEGEAIYPFIERAIYRYQAVQEKAGEIKGLETGVVRIGTISSITCKWMPKLIHDFQQIYPQVKFKFLQGDYTSIPNWVKTGAVDFGFIASDMPTDLQVIPVKEGEMMAVLHPQHPLAAGESVELTQLAKEPFILMEIGAFNEVQNAFDNAGLHINIKYRLHDDYAIMTMVQEDMGVSILAKLMTEGNNYNIKTLPLIPPLTREIGICYKDKESLPVASQYFIKYLMEHKDTLA